MKKIYILVPLLTITAVVFSSCALIIDGVALMKKETPQDREKRIRGGGRTFAEAKKISEDFIESTQKDVNHFVTAVRTLQVGSTTVDQSFEILGRPLHSSKNIDHGVTTSHYNLVDKSNNYTSELGASRSVATADLYFGNDNKLKCVEIIKASSDNGVHTSETIYKKGNR